MVFQSKIKVKKFNFGRMMFFAFLACIIQSILVTFTTIFIEISKQLILNERINQNIVSIGYLRSSFTYIIFSIFIYLLSYYIYGLWISEFKKNVKYSFMALLNFISINSIFMGPGALLGFPNANPFSNRIYIHILVASFMLSYFIYRFKPLAEYINYDKSKMEIFEN